MKQLIVIALFIANLSTCSKPTPQTNINGKSNALTIENGWVRAANTGMMSAAYFTIHNGLNAADTLTQIRSSISKNLQIHESFKEDDGMMGMREIQIIPIERKSTLELIPSGIHVMIIHPVHDIADGDSVDFILDFSVMGEVLVKFPVR